jgi:hypothetical protein
VKPHKRIDPVEIAAITIPLLAELVAVALFIGAVGFWSAVYLEVL